MSPLRCLLLSLSVATFATHASAQELHLSKEGGAIGRVTELLVEGEPNRIYWVVFDFQETPTDLGNGLTLDVSLRWLNVSAVLPGFMGTLNASGRRRVEFSLPDDPALEGTTLSMQCVYCSPVDEVSNLQRVTPAYEGAFADALQSPLVPFLSGIALSRDDGSVEILGESIPVLQRYSSDLEAFEVVDLGCAVGVLSTQTELADGRVLLAGGLSLDDGQPSDAAILYDPATGECVELTMPSPRAGHAAALTGDGEILICGGFETFDLTDILSLFAGIRDDAMLFDPEDSSFRAAGAMLEPKAFHTATTTEDGDVLVAGGLTLLPIVEIPFVALTAYLWDDRSNDFGFLPIPFQTARMMHSAALLTNGKILLVGGVTVDFDEFLISGDPLDLVIGTADSGEVWTDGFLGGGFDHAPGLSVGRALPGVVALPRREALIVGGLEMRLGADLDLVFEPKTEADVYADLGFSATGSLQSARTDPVVVALVDGTILVVGGGASSAEIYQPVQN